MKVYAITASCEYERDNETRTFSRSEGVASTLEETIRFCEAYINNEVGPKFTMTWVVQNDYAGYVTKDNWTMSYQEFEVDRFTL